MVCTTSVDFSFKRGRKCKDGRRFGMSTIHLRAGTGIKVLRETASLEEMHYATFCNNFRGYIVQLHLEWKARQGFAYKNGDR